MSHFTFLIALGLFSPIVSAYQKYLDHFPHQAVQAAKKLRLSTMEVFHQLPIKNLTSIGLATAFLTYYKEFDEDFCKTELPSWNWYTNGDSYASHSDTPLPLQPGNNVRTWGELFGVGDCSNITLVREPTKTAREPKFNTCPSVCTTLDENGNIPALSHSDLMNLQRDITQCNEQTELAVKELKRFDEELPRLQHLTTQNARITELLSSEGSVLGGKKVSKRSFYFFCFIILSLIA
jgi:hypothetical protein